MGQLLETCLTTPTRKNKIENSRLPCKGNRHVKMPFLAVDWSKLKKRDPQRIGMELTLYKFMKFIL